MRNRQQPYHSPPFVPIPPIIKMSQVLTFVAQSSQVGNNTQSVELACGQAAVIKNIPGTDSQSIDVTEFHYDGPPRVTLIFENGTLSDRLFQ